ncbi:MAG TPA: hypothetical protein VIU63_11215 [Nitrospira sp.]
MSPNIVVVLCCAGILLMMTGCSRWIEVMGEPDSAVDRPSQQIAQEDQVPLFLEHIQLTRNGAPQDSTVETEHRMLGTLRGIGLFSRLAAVGNGEAQANEKTIKARLMIDEALDPHPGEAAWKGIVIGASMFLLAPFLPLEYDYAAHLTLELERWDGQIKRYESQSAGVAHYQLFGATPLMIDELKGHVTESCLTALMTQMVQDTPFYMASSAPLPSNPIRSVSVKTRRPQPSLIPAVTISSSPGK